MSDYSKSMPVRLDVTSEEEELTQNIGTTAVPIAFSQDIHAIEIANNSINATIRLKLDGSVVTSSTGMVVYAKGYYAAAKNILQADGISIISDKPGTDVVIIGHFHLTPEEL